MTHGTAGPAIGPGLQPEAACEDEAGDRLLALINAAWVTQVIRTACELELPDHIAAGATQVDLLARRAQCDAGALGRLLRALVALGLCRQDDAGDLSLTPMGERLCSQAAGSLHHWARHAGGSLWQRWSDLPAAVRSGRSVPERHHGRDGYACLADDPAAGAVFHRAMVELTRRMAPAVLAAVPLDGVRQVVDVGGGCGALLAAVLTRAPRATGVLLDQALALAEAAALLTSAGVLGRCRLETGDFFEGVPAGADLYLLKSVLHNWDDERCLRLLGHCARAMRGGARLLVIERLLSEAAGPAACTAVRTDLNMLVSLSGRERSEAEYRALCAAAGLMSLAVHRPTDEWAVLEVRRD